MRAVRVLLIAAVAVAAYAVPADAAPLEEKIVFSSDRDGDYDIYSMNPDGSGRVQLTNDPAADVAPSISPDGRRIAFTRTLDRFGAAEGDIVVMNADGSDQSVVAIDSGLDPDWSPDGAQLVFGTLGHGAPEGLWIIDADGTDRRRIALVDRAEVEPSWAPDNSLIAFSVYNNFNGEDGIYTVRPDGTGLRRITFPPPEGVGSESPDFRFDSAKIAFNGGMINPDGSGLEPTGAGLDPSWSPDGTQLAFEKGFFVAGQSYSEIFKVNFGGSGETPLTNDMARAIDPAWGKLTVLTGPGYPRPKGASPLRVSLVPSNKACSSPNTTHGAPLASGACAPPQLGSSYLTTGTPDANGLAGLMTASMLFTVIEGDPGTSADESDVEITTSVNDVFNKDLTDYSGELRAHVPIRITDRDNLPAVGGPGPGTTQPFVFGFDVPCTPDPAAGAGSDCSLSTSADTLMPGAVKETRRTMWQMGIVRVFDGGADGEGSTTADNTVFAAQGVFVP